MAVVKPSAAAVFIRLAVLVCWPASAADVKQINCDEATLSKLFTTQITEPLLINGCKESDPVFRSLFERAGSEATLLKSWGKVPLKVYPTGPFHLQFGQNFGSGPEAVENLTLKQGVEKFKENNFAFGTQGPNPATSIIDDVRNSFKAKLPNTLYGKFFDPFDIHLFSMGGLNAGACFHYHTVTWLALLAGEKEWVMQSWDELLPKEHYWGDPGVWLKEYEASGVSKAGPEGAPERFAKMHRWLTSDKTYHTVQKPGQILITPTYFLHATRNLVDFTLAVGKQGVADLDRRSAPALLNHQQEVMKKDPSQAYKLIEDFVKAQPDDMSQRLRLLVMLLQAKKRKEGYAIIKTVVRDLTTAVKEGWLAAADYDYVIGQKIPAILKMAISAEEIQVKRKGGTKQTEAHGFLIKLLDKATKLRAPEPGSNKGKARDASEL